jgi:hypothetical protein
MRKRLLLVATAAALALGQPAPALAAPCEDICGAKAAENCDDIDSANCATYIFSCLAGCSTGKIIKWIIKKV